MSSYKILILISNALGDFINFLPFLEHLNVNFPNSEIYLATKKRYFEIFNFNDRYRVKQLIDIESLPLFLLFNEKIKVTSNINFFKNFTKIISFTGSKSNNFKKNLLTLNKNSHFIFPVNKTGEIHESRYLINSFNFKKKFFTKPKLFLPKDKKEYIAIHPGSGDKRKNPSIDFFLELSKYLQFPVKFFGGENEIELKNKMEIKICSNITEVVEILKKAIFYIGNDSGISHLTNAFGLPNFTFFGPTSYKVWKPIGEKNIVLHKNLYCSPCNFECIRNYECLKFNPKDIAKLILNIYKNSFN